MTPLLLLVLSASTFSDALEAYTELRYEDASRHAFEVISAGADDAEKARAYGILGRVAAIDGRCPEATKYFTEMLQGDPTARVESWESPKISPCFANAQSILASQTPATPTPTPEAPLKEAPLKEAPPPTKTVVATAPTEAAPATAPVEIEPPASSSSRSKGADDEAESPPVLFWAAGGAAVVAVVVVGAGVTAGLLLRDQACALSTHCLQTR